MKGSIPKGLYRLALRAFGVLPRGARRAIIRSIAPSWTAGALAIIERDDGRWLLVRPAYRKGWALPGGLLNKGEHPEAGVRRELREELGLNVIITGKPWVIFDAGLRRIDVVFRSTPVPGFDPDSVKVNSAELLDAKWVDPDNPPFLEGEAQDVLVLRRRVVEGGDSVLVI